MINANNLFGRNIELFGGLNKNIFHDYDESGPYFNSSYYPDYGFSIGIGFDSIKIDWLTCRFTLQYDKYKGGLNANRGGLGGGYTTIADINKSVISVGVFPINFLVFKRLNLNFGILISILTNELNNGSITGWQMNQPNYNYILQEKYNQYNSLTYFGLQGRVGYDFYFSKSIVISPQYLYYFGLSNEFIQFPENTKSMKHYFCLGIKKNIK